MKVPFPVEAITYTQPLRYVVFLAVLAGIYCTTFVNYLLFHSLVELVSIVIAFSFFTIAWNARPHIKNSYFLFTGIAYLFIGFLDLLHTLSYKGMNIFTGDFFYANQLWIAARAMESLTLLSGLLLVKYAIQVRESILLTIYSVATALLVASILWIRIFPECFIAGTGQTPFKVASEYVISMILGLSLFLLHDQKQRFERMVYRQIFAAIICTIIAELAFTFYINNYGFSNLVGHYFKLASFWLLYEATIHMGVQKPYGTIFYELYQKNGQLEKALAEIRVLQGILPICMHCKKIRDDAGYWKQMEDYISQHSDTRFSHGLCDDCAKKYYPEFLNENEVKNAEEVLT